MVRLNSPEQYDFKKNGRPIITVGTFDGVHQGHQKVIRYLVDRARNAKTPAIVYSFTPNPYYVVKGVSGQFLLTTDDEKLGLLESLGVDMVVLQPFTKEFAAILPEVFVAKYLVHHLRPQKIVAGYSHVFGNDGEGSETLLKECGKRFDFSVDVINAIELQNEKINSTTIRNYLKLGNVDKARFMLGRPYAVSGTVIKGEGRGRTLSMPTANLKPDWDQKIIPANGIYVGKARYKNEIYQGLIYCGKKPTFHADAPAGVEVHLFNFDQDLYNEKITIDFLTRVRGDKAFGGQDELVRQFADDKAFATNYFSREKANVRR
jgi:riboflavin kinase / FMN adenylyltransferase